MENILQDLRFEIRLLAKRPVFAIIAMMILALGIGANTAIFSMVNAILFKSLPVSEADRLVNIYRNDVRNSRLVAFNFSYPEYLSYRGQKDVFSDVLAFALFHKALTSGGQSKVIFGNLVSGDYFDVLGIKCVLGRTFLPEEDQVPSRNPVIVINHSLWKHFFNGDPEVIGKVVKLNGHDFTIVGVAPAQFRGLHFSSLMTTDVWVPLNMAEQVGLSVDYLSDRDRGWLDLRGRLKDGVTIDHAQAAMTLVVRQLEQAYPNQQERYRDDQIRLVPTEEVHLDPLADKQLFPIAGGLITLVGLILLIACANLANLLLAHAASRKKEIAVRLALGASRGRLIRQLLTESVVLSCLGAAVGLVLAQWLTQLIATFEPVLPIPVQLSLDLSVDTRVLIFTLLVGLLTGVVCGLAPALQATKTNLIKGLIGEGILGPGNRRQLGIRHWLIVPQIALSLLLVLIASLFLRGLYKAQSVEIGFDPDHAAMISLDVGLHGYNEARGREFYRTLLERARLLPGVTSAGLADRLPVEPEQRARVAPEGQPQTDGRRYLPYFARVTPGFLKSLGIPLIRGRDFTERDTEVGLGVAMINETVTRRLWPRQDAIGKQMVIESLSGASIVSGKGHLVEVVGVVQDTKSLSLSKTSVGYLYLPFERYYSPRMSLIVSGPGNPTRLLEPLKRLVQELDPSLTIIQSSTMSERVGFLYYPMRLTAMLSGGFGFLGLLLACVGIYGVIAYSVAQRTREIGIRMALGAQGVDVLKLVIVEGLKMVAIGSVFGLLLAVATTRLLSSFLFGIGATDAVTFVGVPLLFAVVVLLACYVPARKALRVDPMTALRYE